MSVPQRQAKERSVTMSDDGVDAFPLEHYVGYNLRRAAASQRERFRSVFDRHDIRPVQLSFLALIRAHMPARQSMLGKALEMKRANVVTVLDGLIARGLVLREPAEDDRRSNVILLTPAGQAFTDDMLARHDRLERELARKFGRDELAKLVELLQAFRKVDATVEGV